MARRSLDDLLNGVTRFGALTVIGDAGCRTKHAYRFARCRCDCGTEWDTRIDGIRRGLTTSCGCLSRVRAKTLAKETCLKHGDAAGGKIATEYHSYTCMLRRCLNPRNPKYKDYGGRGITIASEWLGPSGYQQFLSDMGRKPSREHTIDRLNNDLGYSAENCRWATRVEQARNVRTNRHITYAGRRMTLAEAAVKAGLRAETIAKRIRRGWSEADAVSLPLGTRM